MFVLGAHSSTLALSIRSGRDGCTLPCHHFNIEELIKRDVLGGLIWGRQCQVLVGPGLC
jgi:hypothetical protein